MKSLIKAFLLSALCLSLALSLASCDVLNKIPGVSDLLANILPSDGPSEPSTPSEPPQPSEPQEPSEPSTPSEPSQPSEPQEPSEPEGCQHIPGEWLTDLDPTCAAAGAKHKECTLCGETLETGVIDKLTTHTPAASVVENSSDSTCTVAGSYDEVVYCSVTGCGIELSRVTAALELLPHSTGEWIVDVEPTCATEGHRYKTCGSCGQSVEAETLQKLTTHTYVEAVCDVCHELAPYSEGLDFASSGEDTCYLRSVGTFNGTILHIPPTALDGKRVTYIPESVFYDCRKITDVIIPDTVTEIAATAFYGCYNIKTLRLGSGLTKIGYNAFQNCSKIQKVFIKDVGQWCSIAFGSGNYANPLYSGKVQLILEGVGTLTEVNIPEGVLSIPTSAFKGQSTITSVSIPASVGSVGDSAFFGCTSLSQITVADGNSAYKNVNGNHLYTKSGDKLIAYAVACTDESYVIADTVHSVEKYAFYGASCLKSLTVPAGMGSFGLDAFHGCTALESVYIYDVGAWCGIDVPHSTVTNTYASPMNYAGKLYLIGADGTATQLTEVIVPDGVTTITNLAFSASGITRVVVPDGVSTIGYGAFMNANDLTAIELGTGIVNISADAFKGCTALTDVYIKDLTKWFSIEFYSYSSNPMYTGDNFYVVEGGAPTLLTHLTVPEGITVIKKHAFYDFECLRSVDLTGVVEIGSKAFSFCDSITTLVIPEGVTKVADSFNDCTELVSVVVGPDVTVLNTYAFYRCYKLVEVVNLSTLNLNNSSTLGAAATYVLEVHTGPESKLVNKDGYLFYTYDSVNYLVGYAGTETDIVLPSDFNGEGYEIYKYAFYYRKSITSLTIPDAVTAIGQSAFRDCTSLESVSIGAGVVRIDKYAFERCIVLSSAVFAVTEGWKADSTRIPSERLSDPETAAVNLSNSYDTYVWKRA